MLRALWFQDKRPFFLKQHAGSLHFSQPDRDGLVTMDFYCPCGCGLMQSLVAGLKAPDKSPTGHVWNGNWTAPTIEGVVRVGDHWSGSLELGYWEAT